MSKDGCGKAPWRRGGRPLCIKNALHAELLRHGMESEMGIPFFGICRLFGGGGESRTPVRERSTQGLYRFSLRTGFRLWSSPQTGVRQLSRRNSSRTPRKEQTHASPMNWRLGDVSDVGRFGVTGYAVRVPHCLRSVGVFVIVVGNYFVAAFYEASGASTCNHGFQHPRRNQCAPV